MSATHSPGAIYDPSTGRDISDPLHPIARLDGRIHEIVDFDYDAVDGPQPEATAPVSQMAAGLCEILSCLAKGRNLKTSGARVLALLAMLDPINSPCAI